MTPAAVHDTEIAMWQSGPLRCVLFSFDAEHLALEVLSNRLPLCTVACESLADAAAIAESLRNLYVEH